MVLDIIIRRYWASKSKPEEGYNEIADLLKPIRDYKRIMEEAEGSRILGDTAEVSK